MSTLKRSAQSGFFGGDARTSPLPPFGRRNFLSNENFRDLLDLLKPGNPDDIDPNVLKQGKEEQYWLDHMEDEHALAEEAKLLASLEEDPELLANIERRVAEIEDRSPQARVNVRYRSKRKQQVLLAFMEDAEMADREVCKWLDRHWEDDPPYGKPFIKAYEGKERPLLQSLISKVRADLRRSRRPKSRWRH